MDSGHSQTVSIRAAYNKKIVQLLVLVYLTVFGMLLLGIWLTDFSTIENSDLYAMMAIIILVVSSLVLSMANIKHIEVNTTGITFLYPFWIIRKRHFPFSAIQQILVTQPFKDQQNSHPVGKQLQTLIEVQLVFNNGKRKRRFSNRQLENFDPLMDVLNKNAPHLFQHP
jgi:hypothetical protein